MVCFLPAVTNGYNDYYLERVFIDLSYASLDTI